MRIRTETRQDYEQIDRLLQTHRMPDSNAGCVAGASMEGIRQSGQYIPGLAFVAEQCGQIVGYAAFTRVYLTQPNVGRFHVLMLSKLCVAREHRGKGIASRLVNKGFAKGIQKLFTAVFTCGDPKLFLQYGFQPIAHWKMTSDGSVPHKYLLGCELMPYSLRKGGFLELVPVCAAQDG
ncbi:MAG: GNAT family N-acetyltransferase [Christensenellales bacterium]|jgi:predicted N-acetyltransferase YhbS